MALVSDPFSKQIQRVSDASNELARIAGGLRTARTALFAALQYYNRDRLEAFKRWLADNGRGWCGVCDGIEPIDELTPRYAIGYGETDEYYPTDAKLTALVRVCASCLAAEPWTCARIYSLVERHKPAEAPLFRQIERMNGAWVEFFPFDERPEGIFYDKKNWIPNPAKPADARGMQEQMLGPPDWQPLAPKVLLDMRFPLVLSDDCATRADLPIAIKHPCVPGEMTFKRLNPDGSESW